jgi:integrase
VKIPASTQLRQQELDNKVRQHSLRHSYASLLATDLSLAPTRLAAILGHDDPAFSMRVYARDTADTATIVADVLARARKAGIGS